MLHSVHLEDDFFIPKLKADFYFVFHRAVTLHSSRQRTSVENTRFEVNKAGQCEAFVVVLKL